ncbi:ethanolamine kinase 1 isoform X2 [Cricetulus griseus]|uniref:ethanolamine kinase n=1 Tax=Cricetulus griseus TaxID=10029 RepID=A0A9J7JZC0_CRIGR|nr:ethanolamine kinase 1 isoform X2 [Cricetulus griseus]
MANYIHVPPGSPEVPKLDVTVQDQEEQRCRDGALSLLRHLRPHWDPREVTLQLFTDGITNKLIACYVGDTMEDVVLVRIYGNKTELLVDRDEEVKSFRVLQAHGCAPQLYCTFNNGLCYEFIQGEALDPQHVCNPAIFRLIARQLAKIHAIHAHNGWIPKSNLWLKMGKYFSLIPTGFADEDINKRFLSDVPSPQLLQEEMTWMKEILSSLGSPVVLCHNDLLCKNIIYNEKQDRYAIAAAKWRHTVLLKRTDWSFVCRLTCSHARSRVKYSSLIMSILDTTTWHMILEIISMNLQVSVM